MIINKYEAASTKVALQDISQHFGDAVFIISNTRLEGRNVVYFATDSIDAIQAQKAPAALQKVSASATKKRVPVMSASTTRKKPATRNIKSAEVVPHVPAALPALPAVTDFSALEQKLEHLQGLLAETASSMTQAETLVSSRLEGVELFQRKQKSGIDQLNRRMARQTELLSAILASMESRQQATVPHYAEYSNGSISPAANKPGHTGYANEAGANHLLTYMKNNGSFYDSSELANGIHVILTDGKTSSPGSIQEFATLLGERILQTPSIICFSADKSAEGPAPQYAAVAVDETELERSIAIAGKTRPIVLFISTRDYLNQAREFKCFTGARTHCYYSHGTALEQLAFLEEVHGIKPHSLSIAELPRPTPGLPELFCLTRGGLPLLFLGKHKSSLSTAETTVTGYLGNRAGTNRATIIGRVLGTVSLATCLTIPCRVVLRKLASRLLPRMEPTDAK